LGASDGGAGLPPAPPLTMASVKGLGRDAPWAGGAGSARERGPRSSAYKADGVAVAALPAAPTPADPPRGGTRGVERDWASIRTHFINFCITLGGDVTSHARGQMIKCALVAGQGARNEADNPESWLSVRTLALCDGIPYCQTVKLGLKSLNGRSGF
jgi:hypothetical protein